MSFELSKERSVTLAFRLRRWWRPIWLTCAIFYALLLVVAIANIVGTALGAEDFRAGPTSWFLLVISAGGSFFSFRKWRLGPARAVSFVLTGAPEEN